MDPERHLSGPFVKFCMLTKNISATLEWQILRIETQVRACLPNQAGVKNKFYEAIKGKAYMKG